MPARWQQKPTKFKTVKQGNYWVKPGGSAGGASSSPAPSSNPYAGLPGYAADYLRGFGEQAAAHQKDYDTNVAPWLQTNLSNIRTYGNEVNTQLNDRMGAIRGSVANAQPTGLRTMGGQMYGGTQRSAAMANQAQGMATNLGTIGANDAAMQSLGLGDVTADIAASSARYRAGLPGVYDQERKREEFKIRESEMAFRRDHKRWGTEMRMQTQQSNADRKMRMAELAAQMGWDQEQFAAEMDLQERQFGAQQSNTEREMDFNEEISRQEAAEAAKPKKGKKKTAATTKAQRRAVEYVRQLKKNNWRAVVGQEGKKDVQRRLTIEEVVEDIMAQSKGAVSRAWAVKMAKKFGAKKHYPDIPTVG